MIELFTVLILAFTQMRAEAMSVVCCESDVSAVRTVQITIRPSHPLKVHIDGNRFKCACGRDPVIICLDDDGDVAAYCDSCLSDLRDQHFFLFEQGNGERTYHFELPDLYKMPNISSIDDEKKTDPLK